MATKPNSSEKAPQKTFIDNSSKNLANFSVICNLEGVSVPSISNINILFCMYITVSFGLLGAFDDFKKIKYSNSSGISSKLKITLQILLAVIGVSLFVYYADFQDMTNLYFPFFKNLIINLGLSLIHISEPTRLRRISFAGLCV